MDNNNNKYTNVHEALHDAAFESAILDSEESVIQSFRIKKTEKAVLKNVCQVHGTDPSTFLRKCVQGLIKDYSPPEVKLESEA